jgi:hypothetical protein
MFLVPWWLYLWMSGSRYSLRRLIGNTLVAAIVSFLAATGWFWAAKNYQQPYLYAITYVEYAAVAAIAYSSLEPALKVAIDSVAQRRFATAAVRQTGWGFTAWWAFMLAAVLLWQAARFPFLHAWLAYLQASDRIFATPKFLVATSLAILPFVVVLRQFIIAADGMSVARPQGAPRPSAPRSPHVSVSAAKQNHIPSGWDRPIPAPPPPPPRASSVAPPRPARIISVDGKPVSPNKDLR